MKNELKIEPQAPAAPQLALALGISTDREGQLCDLIEKCFEDTDNYPLALGCISENVDNVNELAYAIFHFAAFAGEEHARNQMIQLLRA